jgi:hypothetical protein
MCDRITFSGDTLPMESLSSQRGVPELSVGRSSLWASTITCLKAVAGSAGKPRMRCILRGSTASSESVTLSNRGCHRGMVPLANPEPDELLRVPTLRSVWFYSFSFKPALCQTEMRVCI